MKNKKNNVFENLFILFLVLEPITQSLKLLIGFKAQFIFPVFYLLYLFFNAKNIKNTKIFSLFFLFFFVSLIYSIFGYNEHLYNFFGLVYLLFVTALPWLLVGLNTYNIDKLFESIKKNSIYILISNMILVYVCYRVKGTLIGNMEISYSILPLAIFSLYIFIEDKKIINLLIFVISFFIIVSFGSRGPLLCLLVYLILFLIMNLKKHKWLFGLLIILSVFTVFNFKTILYKSIDFLAAHNVESRTLYKIKNGDITNDTGRSRIHQVVYELIDQHQAIGVGLGVERITINEKIYAMNKDMSSCYPHNLFLELIVQYGLFIGIILSFSIVFLIIKAMLKAKGKRRDFLIILFSIEFIRLMISSSYIVSILFFYLIGISIAYIQNNGGKNEKSINNSSI